MEPQLEQIAEQQRESWNRFSSGWKKWDEQTMDFLRPMGDEIIRLLKVQDNDMVLDVASGTGEPGLTIATMLTKGKVISTDLAEGMLEVARENAQRRGITNFETLTADVTNLPFEDNTFDAISCRFGFMFFPDMLLATREMVRVLKPGGRIATAVWDVPERNFWVTAMTSVIRKNMDLPVLPPEAPGMFRCSENGLIAHLFRQSGLSHIIETEVKSTLNTGTPETYWEMMTEIAAPVVSALNNADDALRAKIKSEVFDSVNEKFPREEVAIDASALVYYGEK